MTKPTRFRFRALLVPLAALAVIAGGSTAAFAGTSPNPTPAPIATYGAHHHTPKHCELVLLTGSAADHDNAGQDVGGGYGSQTAAPDHGKPAAERVKVEQLAEVCEQGEHLTVFDVTRAFVQETEPTPTGYPPTDSPSAYTTPAPDPSAS
jgi:hypothetical protein